MYIRLLRREGLAVEPACGLLWVMRFVLNPRAFPCEVAVLLMEAGCQESAVRHLLESKLLPWLVELKSLVPLWLFLHLKVAPDKTDP